jgi:fido (protein-threonine AMPylation protein)
MAVMAAENERADFAALQNALAHFPAGASLEQVKGAAALPVSERTVIRRLAQMIEDGLVLKHGASRAARYVLATPPWPPGLAEDTPSSLTQRDMLVPVSPAGGEILRLVTRPVTARKPVGYNRAILSGYRPNRTSYLTGADKARLAAISKTVDAADPRAGTYAQRILSRLLIDLSWNSSRLEGNTYSLLDTQRLIEAGEAAEGKAATDTQMILNHKAAIEFLVESAEDIAFNRHTILNLHAFLAENLLPNPAAAGRIRQIPVGIGSSVYRPLDIPPVLNECFDELLGKAQAIDDPFEQAFFVMVQLPYLQPFEDVNKRVSRLAANIPLFRRNLAPISFVDVPDDTYTWGVLGVYELNRVDLLKDVFLWAYERSAARYAAIRQTTGEPDQFRLRHRQALKQVVADVIRRPMDQKAAAAHIAAWSARQIPEIERARFVEIAETELMSIHEGNFARYRIRPGEFHAWQEVWRQRG